VIRAAFVLGSNGPESLGRLKRLRFAMSDATSSLGEVASTFRTLRSMISLIGVAGLVSDGVVRDLAGVLGTGLPVWCQGTAAPASVTGLTFVGWQEPIDCGGVAVFPNDVIVVDDDGAVLIPAALLADVTAASVEQERLEGWIMGQVEQGVPLPGLYPPNEENAARYQAWAKANAA